MLSKLPSDLEASSDPEGVGFVSENPEEFDWKGGSGFFPLRV